MNKIIQITITGCPLFSRLFTGLSFSELAISEQTTSCYASRQLYFSNMEVSNLFINLALRVLEGQTENMVRRLDYSPSLLGKHKRTSVFV